MEDLCRTCLNTAIEKISLLAIDTKKGKSYSEMLFDCTGIVSKRNTPNYVCIPCSEILCSAWDFFEMCKLSDERLQKCLQNFNTDNLDPLLVNKETVETVSFVNMLLPDSMVKSEIDDDSIEWDEALIPHFQSAPVVKSEISDDSVEQDKAMIPQNNFQAAPDIEDLHVKKISNSASVRKRKKRSSKFNTAFKCPKCDHISSTECRFKKHLKKFHSDFLNLYINFLCDKCEKIFKRKSDLKVHLRIHSGEKPFCCDLCPKKFAQSGTLIEHKRRHTGEMPFMCKICSKSFIGRSSYWRHKRVHTKEKPYHCDQCGKSFSLPTTLKTHQLVHKDDRPYSCSICQKTTKSKYAMQAHVMIHKSKNFICEQCGKKFVAKANLCGHIKKMHSSEAGRCEICNKDTSNLNNHMNIHSDTPQYECPKCTKTFRHKNSFSFHIRLHDNANKYKCNFKQCTKAFPKANMLDFHIRKCHSHVSAFTCTLCKKEYFRSCDLSKHINSVHHILVNPNNLKSFSCVTRETVNSI